MKKDRLWSLFLIATVIFMIVCGCRLIQIVLRYQDMIEKMKVIKNFFEEQQTDKGKEVG